jgi:phosphopantothenate-cysteine ligase
LERYGHQLVIGNKLDTRKYEVILVRPGNKQEWIRVTKEQVEAGHEIESDIIDHLVQQHTDWIEGA